MFVSYGLIKMLNNYICALDIGSSKIAVVLARIKKNRLVNLYFDSLPIKGVREGAIIDSIGLIGSVGKILKALKAKSGVNIKFVSVNISGQDIITKHSHAIIPLAERGNKVISVSDMQRATEQARVLGSSLEDEIIHMFPTGYSIDSKNNILNPLGLYSHRLEVDLYLVCAKLSSVESLSRVINQSGYEIKNLFFSGIATSKAVFSSGFKEGFNLLCDLGSDTTELLIFKDGLLNDIQILPFGGNDLTQKLSDNLKIPLDLAEAIKCSYGFIGNPSEVAEDKEILVKKNEFYKPIKQRLVAEIITASAREICSKIKSAAEKKVAFHKLSNFVVVGRTILLEGFIETLENTLNAPVKLGRLTNLEIISLIKENSELSGQKYLNYLTCLGMICEALENKPLGILPLRQPAKNLVLKLINRVKEVYQEYF
ncbi:MAG: cell division protein FtsA [Candidatus Omnitrophica bacterium CG23_combo_of_CG06-09_8_20_14_all_41_10]|uniref:Cell division protein FtsA n=1 Tax=Candidatus Sherwoodlollariibacterium unditelluris TaxID=1974757 RepID=A0A2G9YJS2_9BACT|nr:MAG: cell division protein FtsA [Candidatus Omnitrophica bacterium CG23_combo_of_CG06-09_8_20_14_all_41_10]